MDDWEGNLDGISRHEISGWVRRLGTDVPVVVEVVHDNNVLARTIAEELRPDLAKAGKGSGRHGFSFRFDEPLPEPSAAGPIQVRVRDSTFLVPLRDQNGSEPQPAAPAPAVGSPGVHAGYIDRLTPFVATGWAWLPGTDERLVIEAVVDNVVVASAVADIHRADLAAAGVGDGKHAFLIRPPEGGFPVDAAVIRVKDGPVLTRSVLVAPAEAGQAAQNDPREGRPTDGGTGTDAAAAPYALEGFIERLNVRDVIGWVWKPPSDERIEVEILIDDTVVARTIADMERPDLADAGIGDGRHGFHVVWDQAIEGRERAVVRPVGGLPLRRLAPPDSARSDRPAESRSNGGRPAFDLDSGATEANAAKAGGRKRLRVAVVAWDMAHNPVGRAFLLADMAARGHTAELVGPIFQFYGGRIWPPLADNPMRMRGFAATDMRSLVAGAMEMARWVSCDVVYVSKPRLPSLLIGALIRRANNCPMVVDIDDHELSFTKNNTPASFVDLEQARRDQSPDLDVPHSDLWTRFAETLLQEADGITVSNMALRRRFGGLMVRHGRDERVFDPAKFDRAQVRAEFGYGEADRVILFLGTPRAHKGVFAIADALERLGDDRLALCVVGTITDNRLSGRFSAYRKARISLHPDQAWQRLPEIVNMADCVVCLQDPQHAISHFQMPAKLTDALALGIPVIASPVAPLEDVALADVLDLVRDDAQFDAALKRVAESPPRSAAGGRARDYFLSELSYSVNAPRIDLAFRSAGSNRVTALPRFDRLFRLLEDQTGIVLPRLTDTPRRRERRAPITPDTPPRDLVFLWKQNDSDVYGRRSDMVAKYLLRTGRVRRVFHFDAPLSAADLEWQAGEPLIYVNAVQRILRAADSPNFIRRTFLHRSGGEPERALGRNLPPKDAYPDFIRQVLRDAKATEAPLLWVCPIVFDVPEIADAIRPSFVVADIIDDQRLFPNSNEDQRRRVADEYENILREADAVFTNCQPICEAFADLRSDIHVVPNGAELFPDAGSWPVSDVLAGLPRPIIGYVGNLRDRVDYRLLETVATRFPDATVVLVGSARGRPEVAELAARLPNLRLLGVRQYEEAQRIIRGFDVAIIPHLKSELSDRMNPLKLYVYYSLGVPVVSTAVANIGDLEGQISVAQDSESFVASIAAVLAGTERKLNPAARADILRSISWEARVAEIWRKLTDRA